MHPRHLWFVLFAIGVVQAHAGVIYKWKDANGITHYSDQPGPGAQKVTVDEPNRSPADNTSRASRAAPGAAAQDRNSGRFTVNDYTDFEIYAPAQEATLRDNSVDVHIRLEPGLAQNHQMSLYLDGKRSAASSTNGLSYTLEDVARGTHTLQAVILDRNSGESKNSNLVTFNILQHSLATPPRGPLIKPKRP
jgi:Domain of unknown function (DUF4124)